MKLLCTILAFLVLLLSVQPACASVSVDIDTCCSDATCTEQEGSNTESNNKGHENGCSKCCNPFQVCACCAFSVVATPQLFLVFKVPQLFVPVKWGTLPVCITDVPSSGFWQPPKM